MRMYSSQIQCKDNIRLCKCLKIKSVIPGRPEMTENDRKQILLFYPI